MTAIFYSCKKEFLIFSCIFFQFLIQCICSSFGYVQDWFPPANHHRHQFFPHNHNNVNVKNRHPYSWENQYISGSESTRNNVNSNKVLSASKYSFNRPLRYLKPPAINAASSYDKFRTYFDSLDYDDLPPNHRPDVAEENSNKKKKNQEERPKYIRDHAPLHQNSESEVFIFICCTLLHSKLAYTSASF